MYVPGVDAEHAEQGTKSTHVGSDGKTFQDRIKWFGLRGGVLIENVGRRQEHVQHFLESIMRDEDTKGGGLDESMEEHAQ